MADLIEVTPSGAVGKQVYAITGSPVKLCSVVLYSPSGDVGDITIRSGATSGDVKLRMSNHTLEPTKVYTLKEPVRFDKGMHVKVLGDTSSCYLEIQ